MRSRQLHGIVYRKQKFIIGKRLCYIVKCAVLHDFHSAFNGAEGSHDQHGNGRRTALYLLKHIKT